ncbi:ABC transporter permease [Nonomuraea typhae]|uniref:ABC transporter permease n=1 Tax=Nonomuraea typhae TaxID=2603600 RepID=A0ABW7ZC41_9ACTN
MRSYLRLELLRSLRNPVGLVMTTVFPVALYLLWTEVLRLTPPGQVNVKDHMMVSMATYGAMGGAMSIGGAIAVERSKGWLRQLAVTPLPAHGYISAKLLAGLAGMSPSIVAVLATAALISAVRLPPGTWPALAGLIWLGAVPFAALGIAIGYTLEGIVANVTMMVLFFGLSVLGGLWVPVSLMPEGMRTLAEFSPAYQAGSLGWGALAGELPTGQSLAVLAAWTLVFSGLAAWRYRRAL